MKPFSMISIPEKDIITLKKTFLSISTDYKRFSISEKDVFLDIISEYFPTAILLDSDNSNSSWSDEALLVRTPTPRGRAYQYIISIEGIWPVPLAYIESYENQTISESVGRIDFYGAFFHFKDFIPTNLSKLYNELNNSQISAIRCTRHDVALDFNMSLPINSHKWILKGKNAKKTPHYYNCNEQWIFQSFSYLTKRNSGYWLRVYNKLLDTKDKWKGAWYWDNIPNNWTRIEFEFYPPYSSEVSEQTLFDSVNSRFFGSHVVPMGLPLRPDLWFKVQSAYIHFQRYAKSKGITMDRLLEDLKGYHESISDKS